MASCCAGHLGHSNLNDVLSVDLGEAFSVPSLPFGDVSLTSEGDSWCGPEFPLDRA